MNTGILIKAKINNKWETVDIGDPRLTDTQIINWVQYRNACDGWAETMILKLLGR